MPLQVKQLLAGSPLLHKANDIIAAAEATWAELNPIVNEAEMVR